MRRFAKTARNQKTGLKLMISGPFLLGRWLALAEEPGSTAGGHAEISARRATDSDRRACQRSVLARNEVLGDWRECPEWAAQVERGSPADDSARQGSFEC